MTSETADFGKELKSIKRPRFNWFIFLVGWAFVIIVTLALANREPPESTGMMVFAVIFLLFFSAILVIYTVADRDRVMLIIYNKGLWFRDGMESSRFIPWSEIKSFEIKSFSVNGAPMRFLLLVPHKAKSYEPKPTSCSKMVRYIDNKMFGTHIAAFLTSSLGIGHRELYELLEQALNRYNQKAESQTQTETAAGRPG